VSLLECGGSTPLFLRRGALYKAPPLGASWQKSGIELPHSDRLSLSIGHLPQGKAVSASLRGGGFRGGAAWRAARPCG
jgi:hypothetical protein